MSLINNIIKDYIILPPNLTKQFKNYKVSEQAFILLIYFIGKKVESLSFPDLSETFGWTTQDISQYLNELVEQHLIEINMEKHMGKYDNKISLVPFFKQLEMQYHKDTEGDKINLDLTQTKLILNDELIPAFEKAFNTSLGRYQIDDIKRWKEEYGFSNELIVFALQQAVLSGVLNMRYIERILLNWQNQDITTYEEAKIYTEKFYKKKLDFKFN